MTGEKSVYPSVHFLGEEQMTTTGNTRERFIPALSYYVLTPLYDPIMQTLLREESWKRRLIAEARLQKREQVLDLVHCKDLDYDGKPDLQRRSSSEAR